MSTFFKSLPYLSLGSFYFSVVVGLETYILYPKGFFGIYFEQLLTLQFVLLSYDSTIQNLPAPSCVWAEMKNGWIHTELLISTQY